MAAPATKLTPQERAEALSTQQSAIEAFHNSMSIIVTEMYSKNKANADFNAVKDKYLVAKDTAPTVILQKAAPCLYKYREQIKARDEKWLLTHDFNADITAVVALPDAEDVNLLSRLIGQMRNVWQAQNAAEHKVMLDNLNSLLGASVRYEIADRKLNPAAYAAAKSQAAAKQQSTK